MYASIEYAAHFLVVMKEWKDTDDIVPKEKGSLQFVRKREGQTRRSEQCNDLGGRYTCMRCGKTRKHAQLPQTQKEAQMFIEL